MREKIAVVGLGYVGLPLAVALARSFDEVTGFDISLSRVNELKGGHDRTGEIEREALIAARLRCTTAVSELAGTTFFIVTVPTPVDTNRQPDLGPLVRACESIGKVLTRGAVVVFESTVYPGLTRDICGPILAQSSGLRQGVDFKLAYSPERINPGDKEHRLETITKIVSGEDAETLDRVSAVYGRIIEAGIYRAESIEVAETAKVIENTQRDVNIALVNEIALICDRLGISTRAVLEAAGTKWNFLPFRPGLVGGHCIGVDPYYLTCRAEQVGYFPQMILAGRRINDGMGAYIAQRTIKMMIGAGAQVLGARVGILGLTFKEDVPDLRNSRVPDIVAELKEYGCRPVIHDPMADPAEAKLEYGIDLAGAEEMTGLQALIYAVPHRVTQARGSADLFTRLAPGGVFIDVKSAVPRSEVPAGTSYWSL